MKRKPEIMAGKSLVLFGHGGEEQRNKKRLLPGLPPAIRQVMRHHGPLKPFSLHPGPNPSCEHFFRISRLLPGFSRANFQ